ncbi:helix-turn-helix domain-containing protein [Streptomyces sp. NBC_01022]|uniref:helix-turn-helix domain-containing protein n=1 Tax=Streptomyces sp. NBC_01022 TaxID=2903723 RepID=UPI002DD9BCDF|nr:LuxR C-terminal-related transcriptional regulator [Streptomyces sp. NBC_01022]WRZ79116.1 LuxR C-terminal-related transcriptional regulator [Streptomyces sp. NBC_01022]WRZ86562.1 LuxR C-terminal-related transcriptional regulator [Streptomyces sp. NBC_01022]
MLGPLGLDATAETVYRALLDRPHAPLAEQRSHAALTEDQFEAGLKELAGLALVRPASGSDDGRLHAVSPRLGLEMLLARQRAELAARQQQLEESQAAVAELLCGLPAVHPASGEPLVVHLDGVDQVRDYLARIHEDVTEEILTFATGGAQNEEDMLASGPLAERLLSRGVRIRAVYLDSIHNHRPTVCHVTWLASSGVEVRTAPSLSTRMIIADRRLALIALDDQDSSLGALVVTGPGLIAALESLFESVWDRAEPLGGPEKPGDGPLTRQQHETLRLLARGYTDEAIAKRLGVSPRTARRIATGLLGHLDARSRFQAGVHAAQLGYLRPGSR